MITDHLERAAIEIHFALADLSILQTMAASARGESGEEEDQALLAALRFALFELEWVRRRLDGGDALVRLNAAPSRLGASPDEMF